MIWTIWFLRILLANPTKTLCFILCYQRMMIEDIKVLENGQACIRCQNLMKTSYLQTQTHTITFV